MREGNVWGRRGKDREKDAPDIYNGLGSGNDFGLYSNNFLSLEGPSGPERELVLPFWASSS